MVEVANFMWILIWRRINTGPRSFHVYLSAQPSKLSSSLSLMAPQALLWGVCFWPTGPPGGLGSSRAHRPVSISTAAVGGAVENRQSLLLSPPGLLGQEPEAAEAHLLLVSREWTLSSAGARLGVQVLSFRRQQAGLCRRHSPQSKTCAVIFNFVHSYEEHRIQL